MKFQYSAITVETIWPIRRRSVDPTSVRSGRRNLKVQTADRGIWRGTWNVAQFTLEHTRWDKKKDSVNICNIHFAFLSSPFFGGLICVFTPQMVPRLFHTVPPCSILYHFVPWRQQRRVSVLLLRALKSVFPPLPRKEACVEGIWKLYVCGADPLTANDEALSAEQALFQTRLKMRPKLPNKLNGPVEFRGKRSSDT